MKTAENSFNIDNQSIQIKKVPLRKIFWFTKLNIEIHKADPIFKKAQRNFNERLKFFLSFSYKLSKCSRYILLDNDKVVGALSLEKKKRSLFIYAIGLLEKYRRKGYGTILMRFAEFFAQKSQKDYITFSVLLENKPAVSLYEKLGYNSLGLGLTLIRYLKTDEKESQSKLSKEYNFSFRLLKNNKSIDSKAKFWWIKEIEAIAGKEAAEICLIDELLDFDFKYTWDIYEIYYNEETIGIFSSLPSSLFPTIVLFSDPEKTWNIRWTEKFVEVFLNLNLENMRRKKQGDLFSKKKTSFIQIFLTHQHRNSLKIEKEAIKLYYDTTEDRQVYFKKILL